MKRIFATLFLMVVGGLLLAQTPDPTPKKEEPKKKEWYEKLSIGGDFRLRAEDFNQSGTADRLRERFRLRLKMSTQLSDDTKFTFALRSGDPNNPVSDNQDFGNGENKKGFNIAEAYVSWNPSAYFLLNAGKFPQKGGRIYSDMEWDDNVDVEGLLEKLSFASGAAPGVTQNAFNVSAFEYDLKENGASNKDAYVVGIQPYYEMKADITSFILGATYEKYYDADSVAAMTFGKTLTGNPLTNAYTSSGSTFGNLLSQFKILEGFINFKTMFGSVPFGAYAHYYKNQGAYNDQDKAYFLRAEVGDGKSEGTWQARYTYYDLEKEALFYAFVQADLTIGTGSKSHRFDLTYAATKFSSMGLTVYLTKRIDDPTYKQLMRSQLDYVIRF